AEVLGRQTAFAIDALSFLASAWLVGGIRRPMQQARTAREPGTVRDAIGYVRAHPIVLRLVLAKVGASTANGIVGLLPTFALRRFAGTSIATGLLFAARGLGAMTGPILARGAIGVTPGRRAIVILCGVATLTYCVVYTVFPFTHVFAVAMVLVVLAHLGGGANWSLSTYGLQCETPDHVRGRVMSIDYGLATLAIGGSAIAAGLLADACGEAAATWALCAIGGACGAAWLAWSLAAVRGAHAPARIGSEQTTP
ncbi:MAG TPA: MFS transporter, partial [Kofleriaceae bacterium]|nr:MFS transporter [Kofleriaceae bacterium]